jgi:hypothetical protein
MKNTSATKSVKKTPVTPVAVEPVKFKNSDFVLAVTEKTGLSKEKSKLA